MKFNEFERFIVFKDEENIKFLLLSFCAIYLKPLPLRCVEDSSAVGEKFVFVQLWSKKYIDLFLEKNIIKDKVYKQSNGIYDFCLNEKYVPFLLALNEYSSTSDYKKKWISHKEEKLGHSIIKNYKI